VRSLGGAEVALVTKEIAEGSFKASMRSVGMDVAAIAASFGGGGHIRAAGCSVSGNCIEDAEKEILNKIIKSLH
jgi:phosphoesterase RecJ-like protein